MELFMDNKAGGDIFAFCGVPKTASFASVIKGWSTKEVLHWMQGIDGAIAQYSEALEKSQIDGQKLLLLDEDGICELGIANFGIVKMIFQAIQLLNDFCYTVGEENLQTLCLRVCVSISQLNIDMRLVKDAIRPEPSQSELVSLNNIIFFSVCQVIEQLKKVLVWLDRSPFDRVPSFIEFRSEVMADCLTLLRAVCDPYLNRHIRVGVNCITEAAESVYEKCDSIVTTSLDPLVSYTTFFETAVLRKIKGCTTWGFNLQSSYRGVHVVCEVKLNSPADSSGKIDAGDEIIQINGETVIGWESRMIASKLMSLAQSDCCRELILLVNKRPRETTLMPRLPRSAPKIDQARISRGKADTLFAVIAEENHIVEEDVKRRLKPDTPSLSKLPDSGVTVSSANTEVPADVPVSEMFDRRLRIVRRMTVSGSTPPLVEPTTLERSQSLNVPISGAGMEDELTNSSKGDDAGLHVEMVIRRRRTMRQQPGGYVKSFIDNQPVGEPEDNVMDNGDTFKMEEKDTESACTSVCVAKSPFLTDEVESEREPDRYAVIDVVDQCDLDLLDLPPVDISEWSDALKLPLFPVQDEEQAFLERENASVISDDISTKSYSELPYAPLDNTWQFPIATFGFQKTRPFVSSSLKSAIQAPIAETDETSLGWDSDGEVDGGSAKNSSQVSFNENAPSTSQELSPMVQSMIPSNVLRDLSHIPCPKLEGKQLEGWIRRKRLDYESSSSKWIKCWMVLHSGVLYIYQNQYATHADIVIAVAKFIVSDAPELKTSKKYVFRLCRNTSAFYFSAYKLIDMKMWMNKLGLAAICYDQTAEEREHSDTLSRSMVFIASLDDSLRSPILSSSPSPPVHHTLPRAGNPARRMGRIPRQNSLRSPRSSPSTADSVSSTSFFTGRFFRRNDSFET